MNYKITSALENPLIPYKKKVVGKDGSVSYEDAVFDIRNKTYEKLPEELREKFDEYQIETVIHERCDGSVISGYIKRYNNHVAMNTDQKAFTYIDKFASRIRKILESRFFVECNNYSEKDKTKGAVERIVVETLMCINHFEHWKKQPKAACKFLNENATEEEFERFAGQIRRLERVMTEDIHTVFNKKDSFLFLTLFDAFTGLGISDERFADFLRAFQSGLRGTRRNKNGLLFDEIDRDLSTKDKQVITDKLRMLNDLMNEFLQTDEGVLDRQVAFISEHTGVDRKTVHEDIGFYNETLDELTTRTIRDGSALLEGQNRISLLAMVALSYKEDIDLEDWLTEYAGRHRSYDADQQRNYLRMKADLERFYHITIKRSA